MITFNYWRGALLALLCAGPVFLLPYLLSSILIPSSGRLFVEVLVATGVSIPFGALIACPPIFFGGYFMALCGSRDPRARHPLLWGAAGALLAAAIAAVLILLVQADDFSLSGLFAFTGAVCALVVRYGTSWDDETPATHINTHEGEVK